jgi:hypothetical protein
VTNEPANTPPIPDGRLLVTVLGRPGVEVHTPDGCAELRVRRSDGVQILAYLAADPHGATSDQLMAALWPEVRPRYARGRFHTTMSELRAQLTDNLHAEAILRAGGRYHLNPGQVHVDLWRLNQAVERCGCRKPHPCSSRCMIVFVEESAETIGPVYAQACDRGRIRDRLG